MSDTESEDLNELSVKEIQERLKAFPEAKKTSKSKAELVQRLSDYMNRQKILGELQVGKDYIYFWMLDNYVFSSKISQCD